jgi:hypothetical protein
MGPFIMSPFMRIKLETVALYCHNIRVVQMGGCLAVCGGCRIACSEILNLKFGIVQRRIEHPALRLPASGS